MLPGWVRETGKKRSRMVNAGNYMFEHKTWEACACVCVCVCVCVCDTLTENMWGAEGGRCGGVNGNHRSQRSSDTQQESLSLVYTCCYTHTRTHTHIYEPELAGLASTIGEAVVVVLKHRSACINSHKYSCPWTWLAALFMLGMSTRVRETEGGSEKERERERERKRGEKRRESAKWKAERKTDGNEESDWEREIRGNGECDKNHCWLIYTLCYT